MKPRYLFALALLLLLCGWVMAGPGQRRSLEDRHFPHGMWSLDCMDGDCHDDEDSDDESSDGDSDDSSECDDSDDSDDESSDGDSVCERTADQLADACEFDVEEEWLVLSANCLGISDSESREECEEEADEAREEEFEACDDREEAREDACELLDEDRYDPDPLVDPSITFVDPDDVPVFYDANPYVSIVAGQTYVLRAGEEGEELVVVHVTGETKEINGVPCRVVVDVVLEPEEDEGEVEYEPVELTDDWFAQDDQSNVYYCGEIARNYEDGDLTDLDGSFRSGVDFAKGGLLTAAMPTPGDVHRQEYALDEAEDIVQYVALAAAPTEEMGGENEAFPCAPEGCLQTFDFAPLEPESTEFKYYKAGLGFVLAVGMEDGELTGEREEMVCTGDSLEVLEDADCEIADPEALLEVLCELDPGTFCDDED